MTLGSLRWSSLREQLRTSLWFTPVAVTVTCAGAALGLVQLDHALSSDFAGWYVYGGRADGAREVESFLRECMAEETAASKEIDRNGVPHRFGAFAWRTARIDAFTSGIVPLGVPSRNSTTANSMT